MQVCTYMKPVRDRLLAGATDVFARKGIRGATTREIARAAQVNEVTLFRHFKTKDELLRQVCLAWAQRFEAVLTDPPPRTQPELARLVQGFADVSTRKFLENEGFIRTFFGELDRHLPLARRIFSESGKPMRARFVAHLEVARAAGLIAPELDLDLAVEGLSGMLLAGVLRRPLAPRRGADFPRYARHCVDLFLRGLRP